MRFAMITILYGDSTIDFMKFIESNYKYITEKELKIFIIDNGNHNYPIKDHPNILVIKNNNDGFSKSINKGLKILYKEYDYALIVNPDLVFKIDEFISMIPKLMTDFSVIETKEYNQIISLRYFNKLTGTISMKKGFLDIEFFNGPAFVLSKRCFERVQGFDERYFLYFEDLDFSLKLHTHGVPLTVIESNSFVHSPASSSSNIGKRERIAAISGLKFTFKHLKLNLFLYIRYIIKYIFSSCRKK
tara:strand:+ start:657 stop:1391 length:735 start_codon:yes stop_codon:yes gene_type:complete